MKIISEGADYNTKVFDDDGNEITEEINKIEIEITPNALNKVKLTCYASSLDIEVMEKHCSFNFIAVTDQVERKG